MKKITREENKIAIPEIETKITAKFDKGALVAFASLTIGKCLAINGVKLMNGKKGHFVSMPSVKGKDDEYHDIVFPVTKEMRNAITKAVIEAYNEDVDEDDEIELPF